MSSLVAQKILKFHIYDLKAEVQLFDLYFEKLWLTFSTNFEIKL